MKTKSNINQEIHWRTESTYVDIETGEVLTKQTVIKHYTIINKKKQSHVYKQTGTITITNECRHNRQYTLFD